MWLCYLQQNNYALSEEHCCHVVSVGHLSLTAACIASTATLQAKVLRSNCLSQEAQLYEKNTYDKPLGKE